MGDIEAMLRNATAESDFLTETSKQSVSYESFIKFLSERLTTATERQSIHELHATIKAEKAGHLGVRGRIAGSDFEKTFYIDAVWLPKLERFRGKITLNDVPEPPAPKTIKQFINCLRMILNEQEITFEGQVFDATQGVNAAEVNFTESFSAIFDLFERHPEEYFGMPGELIHMMEERGEYEAELQKSLERMPSVSTLLMVNRILNGLPPDSEQYQFWLNQLKTVAESHLASEPLRDEAKELIDFQLGLE